MALTYFFLFNWILVLNFNTMEGLNKYIRVDPLNDLINVISRKLFFFLL
jgi:hypothetical protein